MLQAKGMKMEGRPPGSQFNVLLDPKAGKRLLEDCQEHEVPFVCMTTDVTRVARIGFGTPETLLRSLGLSSFYMLRLMRLWSIWDSKSLAPRGEMIYPHDLSCLLALNQFLGAEEVYSFADVSVSRFEVR